MAETKKNEMTEIGIISKEKTSKERRIEIVVGICGSVIPIICIVFVVNMSGVLREEDNFVYYAIGALCLGLIILPMLNLLKLEKRWKQAETLGAKPKNGLGKA
ncbi:MAG: hypothetical protein KAT70_04475 [Thermoplasmata archaeon]|nr:hypothetical protein [Thermoplasmata archaeon]